MKHSDIIKTTLDVGQALAAADIIRHVSTVAENYDAGDKLRQAHALIQQAITIMTTNGE